MPRPRRFNTRQRPRNARSGRSNTGSNRDGGAGAAVLSPAPPRGPIELPAIVSVAELSELLGLAPAQIIKALIGNGIFATQNQEIDYDTAAIVAADLGFEVRERSDLPAELAAGSDGAT